MINQKHLKLEFIYFIIQFEICIIDIFYFIEKSIKKRIFQYCSRIIKWMIYFNFIRCWTHIQNVISISIESTKRKLRWDDNKIWIEKVSNEMNKHERTKHLLNDSLTFHASVEMMESKNVRLKQTNAWKMRDDTTLMPQIFYLSCFKENIDFCRYMKINP